jgi:hypothetical protein
MEIDVSLLQHQLSHSEPSHACPPLISNVAGCLIPTWALANIAHPQYLDKRLFVQLNGSRKVLGVLRGYDVFLNIVLDEAVEEKDGGEKVKLGMVVRL